MAQPIVQVTEGQLAGRAASDDVSAFLGIPFAAPPLGEKRWRPPAPPAAWQGVRSAGEFAPSCPQPMSPTGFGPWSSEYVVQGVTAEDCLYLNVWAPAPGFAKLPVMVWIHGGAFLGGSGSVPIYDGAPLAAQGLVVVTINYRLGALGFLAHPDLTAETGSSGNYGLMDQIAALQWVQQNIDAFGGDPTQVTIAGQSAGALSVLALLEAPPAKGLFARAIAQSGAGLNLPIPSLAAAETAGRSFAEAKGAKTIADLRALPVDQLIAAPNPGAGGDEPLLQFVPIHDGKLLSEKASALADVPLMTGLTADEGSGFNPLYGRMTLSQFQTQVRKDYGSMGDELLGLYPAATDAEARLASLQLTRDRGVAATLLWLEHRAPEVRAPAYAYLYDHAEPGHDAERFAAFHSSELPYVFKTLDKAPRPFTDRDHALANLMSSYWVNFIRGGDPNGSGLPAWPLYQAGHGDVMELGDHPGVQQIDSRKYEFFRRYSQGGGLVSLF